MQDGGADYRRCRADRWHLLVQVDHGVADISPRELLAKAREHLGPTAELELARDVLEKLVCPKCGREESMFISLGKAKGDLADCPNCAGARREVVTFFKIRGDEAFIDRPLSQIGVPQFDIIIARGAGRSIGFELTGDAASVLGLLWSGSDALEWQ